MRPSPLLSAAAAAALVAAVAAPATAAEPTPARGVASSTVTLLGVAAGGHTVSAGTLELLSDMLGAQSVAEVALTPLVVDGTAYGKQVVRPGAPVSTPALSSSAVAALNGLVGVTSPVLQATASTTGGEPRTSAGAGSFGGLSVLGLPVTVDGTLDVSSLVTRAGGAAGTKEVTVEGLALPSVADLLAALGLDLSALPLSVLNELLVELDLVDTAVTTANQALTDATAGIQTQVDAAQKAIDDAAAALAAETAKLAGPQSELAAKEKELAAATAALQPAKDAVAAAQSNLTAANGTLAAAQTGLAVDQAAFDAAALLPIAVPAAVTDALTASQAAVSTATAAVAGATAAVTTATSDLAAAQSAVDVLAAAVTALKATIATIQRAVDGLQATLDAAVNALKNLLTGVSAEIDALLGAIMAVLDGTPLVSLDSLSVVTEAAAASNTDGGQTARVVGGEVVGLEVLGTDVLQDVLGTTSVDLLDLVGGTLADVNALVADLTGTLSSVLSTVPQFPTLSVPAPQVGLLTKSASTDVVDGFGVASTSVKGLSITLPSVSVPTALAVPGAAALPALGSITQAATGLLSSAPVKLDLVTLGSAARFAPAVGAAAPTTGTPTTGTPTTGTPDTAVPTAAPQLPRTGTSSALAALGVALMVGAVVARRRSTGSAEV